ncbi:MAG: hypothetical protein AAF647_02195 [Pseudomonadota bacterium]
MHDLMLWRQHRGAKGTPGEGALSKVAQSVDAWLAEDRSRIAALRRQEGQK